MDACLQSETYRVSWGVCSQRDLSISVYKMTQPVGGGCEWLQTRSCPPSAVWTSLLLLLGCSGRALGCDSISPWPSVRHWIVFPPSVVKIEGVGCDWLCKERKEERLALVTKLKNISTQHTHTHILRSKHQPSCIYSCTYLLDSMLSCYIALQDWCAVSSS